MDETLQELFDQVVAPPLPSPSSSSGPLPIESQPLPVAGPEEPAFRAPTASPQSAELLASLPRFVASERASLYSPSTQATMARAVRAALASPAAEVSVPLPAEPAIYVSSTESTPAAPGLASRLASRRAMPSQSASRGARSLVDVPSDPFAATDSSSTCDASWPP